MRMVLSLFYFIIWIWWSWLTHCVWDAGIESSSLSIQTCIPASPSGLPKLIEGIKSISAGTVDYTEGADIRPTRRQSAMKSEAHESLVRG